MPKIAYVEARFRAERLETISKANAIIDEYAENGLELTLRQIYYQFVARGYLANSDRNYQNLGETLNAARMAGLVDWEAITDRTRELAVWRQHGSPDRALASLARDYHRDLQAGQPVYLEVWVEKDALKGIVQSACSGYDVPFFSCRGYASVSEMWAAGQRLARRARAGQRPVVLHLGDHDPSGVDMTRDIQDRLELFAGRAVPVQRLALNMDQIDAFGPPPNPAKLTDSRAASYLVRYGDESWELDALDPLAMRDLIRAAMDDHLDLDRMAVVAEQTRREQAVLAAISARYDELAGELGQDGT